MSNSPKLYFLKNKDNKFLNGKDKTFYSNIVNSTYEKKKQTVLDIIKYLPAYSDCEVHEMTENNFMEAMANETTKCVVVGAYLSNILTEIDSKLPTVSQVNKTLHIKLKTAIDSLVPFTSMYNDFIKQKEDQTDEVSGHIAEYLHLVSQPEIYLSGELAGILKAYKKDRKAIIGIAQKTLNRD
ncbi:MAG: hypothetical protein KA278_00505 [Flavobacterium sp.]|nr:hypothetical protein [Flavobacterium sp.]MBP6424180.1 hypothetical protein [Flavobacterium sp.]